MSESTYWENLAKNIKDEPLRSTSGLDPFERLRAARASFQNGFVLLLTGDIKGAVKIFRRIKTELNTILYIHGSSDDFVIQYIIETVLTNTEKDHIALVAAKKIEKEIFADVMKYESRDIYDIYNRFIKHDKTVFTLEGIDEVVRLFRPHCADKYSYENIADQALRLARINIIMNRPALAKENITAAIKLYDLAIKIVEATILKENPGMKTFLKKNIAANDNSEPINMDEKEKFLKRHEELLENIPVMIRQARLINTLCDALGGSGDMLCTSANEKLWAEMEAFYKEYIHRSYEKKTPFGIVESIEWVMILRNVAYLLKGAPVGKDIVKFLKDMLG